MNDYPSAVNANVLGRIAKLLVMAESTHVPNEAAMFSERAAELLLKYRVDEATARQHLAEQHRVVEQIVRSVLEYSGIYRRVLGGLSYRIVNALGGLRAVSAPNFRRRNVDEVWIIGHETDVMHASLLVTSLHTQCQGALERWWSAVDASYLTAMQRFKNRREFIYQFGVGAASRVERARQTSLGAVDSTTALVLRRRDDDVDDFMRHFDLTMKSGGSWLAGALNAADAGHQAGLSANTHDTSITGDRRLIGDGSS